jgi:hypothetical protein
MSDLNLPRLAHRAGNLPSFAERVSDGPVVADTYAGPVRVELEVQALVTPLGHFAFFVGYLKASGRFDALVADCPLIYTSGQRAGGARLCRHGGSREPGGALALRASDRAAGRFGQSGAAGDDPGDQRGRGAPGFCQDRPSGGSGLVELEATIEALLSGPSILDCNTRSR